jgi:hypothetical protein
MEYTLEVPALLGDLVPLDAIARVMARRAANASTRGFHRPTYEGKLSAYRSAIVDAARVGQLKVCDQEGSVGTTEVILDASKRNHSFIEAPNNEIFTLSLNVYVSLYQLNIWAKERGDVFHITNDGVPWIDERGWNNTEKSLPPLASETDATLTEPHQSPTEIEAKNRLLVKLDADDKTVDAQAASVVTESASGGVKSDEAGPLPLTTGDMAFCFAGLRWSEHQWKKPLGDKPKWLSACVAIPGRRGASETRWNPVFIGAALVRAKHVKPNSVRAKFQSQSLLQPWLDEWKTYEADNFDSNYNDVRTPGVNPEK